MNIKNIALVRATDIIPFEGIVNPLSEVPYLKKENGTEFSFAMLDLLRREGKLKEVDWTKADEINEVNKENSRILSEYMPYSSDYNSMVLWALNGLVPDDMNNTFSNKTCAIIDGLEEQIEQSNVISLMPTDTAIKGNVNLSKQASILISKERYERLSQEEKEKLSKLDVTITIFEGDLKENVDKELQKDGRYTAETLSLRREDDGYIKSDTSDKVRQTVENIANEKKIAQVLHWNVITGQNDELDKLESVKNEFKNGLAVADFYKKTFFEYLFSKMDIDNQIKSDVTYLPESPVYMQALCDEIEKIGIDKYKAILDQYNKTLEQLRKNGKLPTPQEIVDSKKENKAIDLITLIEELDKESILTSAINATKEDTRLSLINEQARDIKEQYQSKDEVISKKMDRSE